MTKRNKQNEEIYLQLHLCLLEKSNSSLGGIPADKRRCAYAIGSPNATNIAFRYQCVTCYWWAASRTGSRHGLAGARVKSGGALDALRHQAQTPHWAQHQLPIGCGVASCKTIQALTALCGGSTPPWFALLLSRLPFSSLHLSFLQRWTTCGQTGRLKTVPGCFTEAGINSRAHRHSQMLVCPCVLGSLSLNIWLTH